MYDGIFGYVSIANFEITDQSTVNIYGGWGLAPYSARGSSMTNIYDGIVCTMGIYDSSKANIYGGQIGDQFGFEIDESAVANIYGYDFNYDPQARLQPQGWVSRLTGRGLYGTPISIWGIPDPYSSPNINLIPEPGTFVLLGLGALGLLRRRRRGAIYPE